jgi:hypothetical protein
MLGVVLGACSATPSESVGASAAAIFSQPDLPPQPPGPPGKPPVPAPRDAGAVVDAAVPKPVLDAAIMPAAAMGWVYARLTDTQVCADVLMGADRWVASFTFGADAPRRCTFGFLSATGAAASAADRGALAAKLSGAFLVPATCGDTGPCVIGTASLVGTGPGAPLNGDGDGGGHEGGISCGACAPVGTVVDNKVHVVLPPWLVRDGVSRVELIAHETSVTIDVPAGLQVFTAPLDAVAPSAVFTLYYMPPD